MGLIQTHLFATLSFMLYIYMYVYDTQKLFWLEFYKLWMQVLKKSWIQAFSFWQAAFIFLLYGATSSSS